MKAAVPVPRYNIQSGWCCSIKYPVTMGDTRRPTALAHCIMADTLLLIVIWPANQVSMAAYGQLSPAPTPAAQTHITMLFLE